MKKLFVILLLSFIIFLFNLNTHAIEQLKWTHHLETSSGSLNSVVFAKGHFVAVGDYGIVKVSDNGATWKSLWSGFDASLCKIIFDGKKFITVGSKGTILNSEDGETWTRCITQTDKIISDIIFDEKNKYLAVGYEGTVLTSEDGITWTKAQSGINDELVSVVNANNKFYALGHWGSVVVSDDKKHWKRILKSEEVISWSHLIWFNNSFYCRGHYNGTDRQYDTLLSSTNCLEWKINDQISDDSPTCSLFENPKESGLIYFSSEKVYVNESKDKWLEYERADKSNDVTSIAYGNSVFVAVGYNGNIEVSKELDSWNFVIKNYLPRTNDAVFNGKRFVTVGQNGKIFTSINGKDWQEVSSPLVADLKSIIWDGEKFIAVGKQDTVITSTDGLNWDVSSYNKDELDNSFSSCITFNNETFAIYNGYSLIHSKDLVKWDSTLQIKLNTYTEPKLIIKNNTLFVVNAGNTLYSSKDGIKWSQATVGNSGSIIKSIEWNGKIYIVAEVKDGTDTTILSSLDGMDWVERYYYKTDTWQSTFNILWNGKIFVAGGDRVLRSIDGIIWKEIKAKIGWNGIKDLLWDGTRFIAAGETIAESVDGNKWNTLINYSDFYSIHKLIWNGYTLVGIHESCYDITTVIPFDIIKVKINDVPIVFDVAPKVINNRTMIPARAILEKIGATLEWDSKAKTIRVVKGNINIILSIDSTNAFVNGKKIILDSPATIIDGRTLLPLRFLSENLGSNVIWDQKTKTIFVSYY